MPFTLIIALSVALGLVIGIVGVAIARRRVLADRRALARVRPDAASRYSGSARRVGDDRWGVLGLYDDELVFVAPDDLLRVPLISIDDTTVTGALLERGARKDRPPEGLCVHWKDGGQPHSCTWEVYDAQYWLQKILAAR